MSSERDVVLRLAALNLPNELFDLLKPYANLRADYRYPHRTSEGEPFRYAGRSTKRHEYISLPGGRTKFLAKPAPKPGQVWYDTLQAVPSRAIIDGILAVEKTNAVQRYKTPAGSYPRCMNALGTMICERCGKDVRDDVEQPCSAVPADQRWDIKYPEPAGASDSHGSDERY